jgi:hypothetical protein
MKDEQTHLSTLRSVAKSLGGETSDIDSCQLDFTDALSTVGSFLATARVLEFIGVDALVFLSTCSCDSVLIR